MGAHETNPCVGVLFICFNVDHRILYGELTDEAIQDGFKFYETFFNAPPAIKAMLHGMIGVGILGLGSKLATWTESAMFFDGSALGRCNMYSFCSHHSDISSQLLTYLLSRSTLP